MAWHGVAARIRMKWAGRMALVLACMAWGGGGVGAATLRETFATSPFERGWQTTGEAGLFGWDPAKEALSVAWDSGRSNSFALLPLGITLSRSDAFTLGFDLWLDELSVGVNPAKPHTFEVSAGLLNLADATAPGFVRGTGSGAVNLVEFAYFADSGFGATVSPTLLSSNGQYAVSFTFPMELKLGVWHRIRMSFDPVSQRLKTTVERNGERLGPVEDVWLRTGSAFSDFRVDAFAVCAYSDAGATGSLRAAGWVDQVEVTWEDPPLLTVSPGQEPGQVRVRVEPARPGFVALERSEDLTQWETRKTEAVEKDGWMDLADQDRTGPRAFYRARWTSR